jgi:hypothetical protein
VKLKTVMLTAKSMPSTTRTTGVRAAYCTPSATSSSIVAFRRGEGWPGGSVKSAAPTARMPAALTTKAGTTPKRAMTSPATAGPTMRAALKEAELSATALTRSRLATSSAR